MIITEQVFKKSNNIITQPFTIREENSKTSSSGNSIIYSIQEAPVRMNMVQENISMKHVEERVSLGVQVGIKGDKGDKGDTGENGESGASSSYTYTAGEILGGHRAIVIDNNLAYYTDCTNLDHINKPIGISSNASISGGNVTVVFYGEMEESSWNWDITKPIWISTNGLLTQTPAISGFSCIIATPITTTKIFIEKQEIFIL